MNNKKKQQKVQMPASIRKKMMAATSMLLVAAIMLVSASYAWFTLSTAPEITGITTSVGANGNLEIALLNTDTFNDTSLITSNTGDSMAAANQTKANANITWGNLVDLSDSATYGLDKITLYPAALNGDSTSITASNPLSTPVYGADGRVNTMQTNTVTAAYTGSAFAVTGTQSYGVRAVGVSSTISARQIAFNSAVSNVETKGNNAEKPMKNAVADASNMSTLLQMALKATGGTLPTSYKYDELVAMKSIAEGVQKSLNNIVSAYANAVIAAAADGSSLTDDEVAALSSLLSGVTSATELKSALSGVSNEQATKALAEMDTLASAQTAVEGAISSATTLLTGKTTGYEYSTDDATTINNAVIKPLLGESLNHSFYDADGNITSAGGSIDSLVSNVKFVYLTGGAAATVASYTGEVKVAEYLSVSVYIGEKSAEASTSKMDTLISAVKGLTGPASTGEANITEYYGYILDFAFRTNAADSNLQLQTSAVNRVYTNETSESLATQGGGSNATFAYSEELSAAQATALLESIRIVFFDPETGTVYQTAAIGTIDTTTTEGTAVGEIYIISTESTDYVLGKDAYEKIETTTEGTDGAEATTTVTYNLKTGYAYNGVTITSDNSSNYAATLDEAGYAALKATTQKAVTTSLAGDETAITKLQQSTVQKVSAMVYLDGEHIDNSAVASGTSSGSLKLNLQFSSSATLTPMENTTLKTMTKTTTTTE